MVADVLFDLGTKCICIVFYRYAIIVSLHCLALASGAFDNSSDMFMVGVTGTGNIFSTDFANKFALRIILG